MLKSEEEFSEHQVWLGADVSKKTFDVGLLRAQQHPGCTPVREVMAESFARTAAGARECIRWAHRNCPDATSIRLVMEATGDYSTELAKWFSAEEPALGPAIVNPARTKAFIDSLGLRTKTDRSDARALAIYGAQRRPAAYEPLDKDRLQLRSLSRYRDTLVGEKVAVGNREEHESANALVRKLQKQDLALKKRRIIKVGAEMQKVIKASPNLSRDYKLLLTIDGVGPLTAALILAEVGDLRRFNRARQLSAFIGLSPRHRDSGTSVHARPRICKQGNPRVRAGLYMAAMAAVKMPGKLREHYQRLIAAGKAPKSALCAVMRKLLVVMRAVIISETPYEPTGKPAAQEAEADSSDNAVQTLAVESDATESVAVEATVENLWKTCGEPVESVGEIIKKIPQMA